MGIVEGPIAGGRVGGGQRLRRGAGVRFPRGDLENSKSNALLDELNALPKELGNGLRLLRTQRGARFEIAGAHVREQRAPLAWGKGETRPYHPPGTCSPAARRRGWRGLACLERRGCRCCCRRRSRRSCSASHSRNYLRHEILLSIIQNRLLFRSLVDCRTDGKHFFLIGRRMVFMRIRQRGQT